MVTNNSILRVGARREREPATQPFSLALLTGEHGAAGRRRGATRTGTPSPTPAALPSVRLTVAGQSISWPRDCRDSGMPGLRPTGLPHFALSISPAILPRTSTFHFETLVRPLSYQTCPTQKTGVVNSWTVTVEKSVAFVKTSPSLSLYLSSSSLFFGDK